MIILNDETSKSNYYSFIWHAGFLALASSFMDIDTIMPAMLGEAGGKALQMGILVTIMMGGSSFSQILFAPYLHNKNFKKKFLLLGINLRIFALMSLAILFFYFKSIPNNIKIWAVLILVSIFSFSGAFANISYVDILGKSIKKNIRKSFLSFKQTIFSIGIFISAIIAKKILSFYTVPMNYSILFIFAALFLTISSLGFWKIKEVEGKPNYVKNLIGFIKFVRKEIKENKKLRIYLLIINTLGISISLMPFLILYAKENLISANIFVGNLLMIKVTGGIIMGFLFFYFSKKIKYLFTLYTTFFLSIGVLILAFLSSNNYWLFYIAFLLGGVMLVTYVITINGILLEITDNKNRSMYAGLAGAGNIMPAIFPLFGGWIIKTNGFNMFFLIIGTIIMSSLIFIIKLDCEN